MSNIIVKDGQGALRYVSAHGSGVNSDPFIPTSSQYYLEVARGNVLDSIAVHKFGAAADIDDGDGDAIVWDGCCEDLAGPKIPEYTFSTTADISLLTSSDITDNADIEIQGLDASWNLVTQVVTLNGQTDVALPTPLLRAFRMINRGSSDVAGTVYLRTSPTGATGGIPDTSTSVRAIIKDGDNQTQMAIYTVPAGYNLYITHGWASMTRRLAGSAVIKIKRRDEGGVFRVLHTLALNTAGTSSDHRPYTIPLKLPAKTDIIYTVPAVSNDNIGISAGFHGVLIGD